MFAAAGGRCDHEPTRLKRGHPGNAMQSRRETILVVIDAQRAFVDPAGSLMRAYGIAEVQPGLTALGRLCAFLTQYGSTGPTVFVRSEYQPGQFSSGQLDHPLADLCVPGRNVDCEWADGLEVRPHHLVVTKHHADAWQSDAYRTVIGQAISEGARQIVLCGFQFTTCVAASAVSTLEAVRASGVEVAVIESLTGIRNSSYMRAPAGESRVDATRRQLRECGVELWSSLDR